VNIGVPTAVEGDPSDQQPAAYTLSQNYPNPFNPSTTINFTLPSGGFVTLEVRNVLGQLVATLVNESLPAGAHSVRFDAKGLASGTYFYRLRAGEVQEARKMILMK
jgi:phosphodiesterase/alkaline phosphatase D-like protein